MADWPQWVHNAIALGFVLAGPVMVGVVAWCLCAVGDRSRDDSVEVISEDLDVPKKRQRQKHVDGG